MRLATVTPLHPASIGRPPPSVYLISYFDGDIIPNGADDPAYVVCRGAVRVETEILTPTGYRTYSLGSVEAGEPFNLEALYQRSGGAVPHLRYVAQATTEVLELTQERMPQKIEDERAFFKAGIKGMQRRLTRVQRLAAYNAEQLYANSKRGDAATIRAQLHSKEAEIDSVRAENKQLKELVSMLARANNAARAGFEEELAQVGERSRVNYEELERLRKIEASRWGVVEQLFEKYGVKMEKLSKNEIERLLGLAESDHENTLVDDEASTKPYRRRMPTLGFEELANSALLEQEQLDDDKEVSRDTLIDDLLYPTS